jgi:hypothetical protein
VTAHAFWVLVHVLLLVYWLGADLGVFYASFLLLDRSLAPAARGAVARLLVALDLAPRVCLVLMLPSGLTLAGLLGLSPVRGGWLLLGWALALGWLAVVLALHQTHGSAAGGRLAVGDAWFRGLLVVVLVVVAATSLAGAGPLLSATVAWKVLLFAVAVACGLGIRLALRPFGPALAAVVAGTASEADERALATTMRRSRPLVLVIWAAVLAAAALGVSL